MLECADYCGVTSGYHTNKCADAGIAWSRGAVLDVPVLDDSPYCMEDITVPVSRTADILDEIESIARRHGVKIPCFGHAGDGNVHATLLREDFDEDAWREARHRVLEELYQATYRVGGNLTGEHGIGAKRIGYLPQFVDRGQIEVMKAIKRALDPDLILNPGKVIDPGNSESAS
ncbi:MAG: FAD-linked oxidase C-terminal domain-containing protein [Bacillota bacterium]|nr:FAD-linked oxidase C-terminal domain-containing protein [Bacillota bacterium]